MGLTVTDNQFRVETYEKIDYTLRYVDGVFSPGNDELARFYEPFGRCLMVVDQAVHELYGEQVRAYFEHHAIALTVFPVQVRETEKSLRTVEKMVDAFARFGLLRQEPVLVVGGGLTTDVAGFACASFRRSSNYLRIPTTLIGLIDASVSIKVGVNHGRYKNRLGAYHASQQVLLDFSFLRTLPRAEVRNGMAELIKIATVADSGIFEALEKHGEDLLRTRFGHDGAPRSCCRWPTRSPTPRSSGCSGWRRPTCTSSTWTGSSPSATPGARPSSWPPPARSSTGTRSASTWPCRPPWPRTAVTSPRASVTACSG